MVDISKNGIITIHRGDTFNLYLTVDLGDKLNPQPYTLNTGDYLYFALLEPNQRWEDAILKKTFDADDYKEDSILMHFTMEDTEFLEPGNYYYEIKLYRSAEWTESQKEEIDTLTKRTKFVILE